MKKIILSIAILILLVACGKTQTPTVDRRASELPPSPNPEPPATAPTQTGQVTEITMEAKQFDFVPSEINVKEGDRVRLIITSTDVEHGISIPEFGVNEILPPGKEVTIEFTADKKGDYPFVCSVYCGSGHQHMRGVLHVS